MKSAGIAAGVALSIVLTLFALTCTGKSPPVDVPSPNLPLRTLRNVPLSGGATRFDYQSFDPIRFYVSDLHGNTDTVIDAQSNQHVTTISLGGGAGNTQFDSVSKHIYVTVHGKNQLAKIDR